ncbi:hypothetical protein C8B47_15130, partial [filamentous cyanobacterium CCP4]
VNAREFLEPETQQLPSPILEFPDLALSLELLEEAIAKGSGALWIIHGHGTGKLKAGVHEYLKRHPQVQRFEPAAQADGGTGVTVAYL